MNKLDRSDINELQQLADDIKGSLAEYEELRAQVVADIEKIITELNQKRERAWEIVDQAATDADAYFDERSEKWQEGDKGQRYAEWRDELQRVAGEIEEAFELPEFPGDRGARLGRRDRRHPLVGAVGMTDPRDRGYTVARCKSGLDASTALSAGGDFWRRHYEERIRFWEAQLKFAEAREAAGEAPQQ